MFQRPCAPATNRLTCPEIFHRCPQKLTPVDNSLSLKSARLTLFQSVIVLSNPPNPARPGVLSLCPVLPRRA